jgi:hypothetical protein
MTDRTSEARLSAELFTVRGSYVLGGFEQVCSADELLTVIANGTRLSPIGEVWIRRGDHAGRGPWEDISELVATRTALETMTRERDDWQQNYHDASENDFDMLKSRTTTAEAALTAMTEKFQQQVEETQKAQAGYDAEVIRADALEAQLAEAQTAHAQAEQQAESLAQMLEAERTIACEALLELERARLALVQRLQQAEQRADELSREFHAAIHEPEYAGTRADWQARAMMAEQRADAAEAQVAAVVAWCNRWTAVKGESFDSWQKAASEVRAALRWGRRRRMADGGMPAPEET